MTLYWICLLVLIVYWRSLYGFLYNIMPPANRFLLLSLQLGCLLFIYIFCLIVLSWNLVTCWIKVASVAYLSYAWLERKGFPLFIIEYDVNCVLSIYDKLLLYWSTFPLYRVYWEFLLWMDVQFLSNIFLYLLRSYDCYPSCYWSWVDLQVLKHPCIPGINHTKS